MRLISIGTLFGFIGLVVVFSILSITSTPKGGDDGFVVASEEREIPKRIELRTSKRMKILVVLESAPENTAIRDLYRTELYFSAPVKLWFLVDPNALPYPSATSSYSLRQLQSEKTAFRDIQLFPTNTTSLATEKEKLQYMLSIVPSDIDFVITATENTLLFMDHIYAQLNSILSPASASPPQGHSTNNEDNVWEEICIIRMNGRRGGGGGKGGGGGGKKQPEGGDGNMICSFGENHMPRTLFDWIGGRCQSPSIFYLRNTGPSEVLKQFGRRVYVEHRRSKSFCREDWEQIAAHNKVWIDMMKSWVAIAARYNIKWFLGGGALIGSARHQGFLPYDGTIDLMVLPESLEDFVRALLTEDLPMSLSRSYEHGYIRIDDASKMYFINLPPDWNEIPSSFKGGGEGEAGCSEGCWTGVGLVSKLRHNRSCYGGPWTGGYVADVYVLPPAETPQLTTCTLEGMMVPCPANIDAWVTKEFGSNWVVPQDSQDNMDILKLSNPFMACDELP